MLQLFGLVLVLVVVAGGLLLSGGPAILAALPFELALICGAGLGTLLIGNSPSIAKAAIGGLGRALRGASWKRQDYEDLLVTLHALLCRVRREGLVAIESDIEAPESSDLFKANPGLLNSVEARNLICDTFRLAALDPGRKDTRDESLRERIELIIHERYRAVSALQTLSDALPALGIVAAVLGIIKTMGVIDQSPAILGEMIAAALLGTFLGVFLAYGLVGPLANRFGQLVEEDARYLDTIRKALVGHFSGAHPMQAIEEARADLPATLRPDPGSVDQAIMRGRFNRAAA